MYYNCNVSYIYISNISWPYSAKCLNLHIMLVLHNFWYHYHNRWTVFYNTVLALHLEAHGIVFSVCLNLALSFGKKTLDTINNFRVFFCASYLFLQLHSNLNVFGYICTCFRRSKIFWKQLVLFGYFSFWW